MGCSTSAVESDHTGIKRNSKPVGNSPNRIDLDTECLQKDGSTAAESKTTNTGDSLPPSNAKTHNGVSLSEKLEVSCADDHQGNQTPVNTHPFGLAGTANSKWASKQDQLQTVSFTEGDSHVESIHGTKTIPGSFQGAGVDHGGQSIVADCCEVQIQNPKRGSNSSPPEPRPDNVTAEPQLENLCCGGDDPRNAEEEEPLDVVSHPTDGQFPYIQPDSPMDRNKTNGITTTACSNDQRLNHEGTRIDAPREKEDKSKESNQDEDRNPATANKEIAESESSREQDLAHQIADEHQSRFSQGLRRFCRLVNPRELLQLATPHVRNLTLDRAPASGLTFPFRQLLKQLTGITELNLSGNHLGPQAVRVISLAMCHNVTIKSLNISNNQADTDSSECLGKMLSVNHTLAILDVSSNQLGRDFFSRCVGPALCINTTLDTLRASSCGLADLGVLLDGLAHNASLQELDISHNQMTDSQGFVKKLREVLKSSTCQLRALHIRNCSLMDEGMKLLVEALRENSTLEKLNAGGNTMACPTSVSNLLVACIRHPTMTVCNISDTGVTSLEPAVPSTDNQSDHSTISTLRTLSIANCSLSDDIILALANQLPGSLSNLSELDVTGNSSITVQAVKAFLSLMDTDGQPNNLRHLRVGSLTVSGLPDILQGSCGTWGNLRSLDLRRAKVSPLEVAGLAALSLRPDGLSNLCLDGLKLSGSHALEHLLSSGPSCSITSLSLASCALQDSDLAPITAAVSAGWAVQSIKLSANRITDTGAVGLIQAFLSKASECTVEELNLANNRLSGGCAAAISKLVSQAPNLHSLLLGHNALGGASLQMILSSLCPMESANPKVLDLAGQEAKMDESEIEELLSIVAQKLGFEIMEQEDGVIKYGSVDTLPRHPHGLTLNLTGLGGTGEAGQALDSPVVKTDYARVQRPWLSLQHSLDLADWLKGRPTSDTVDDSDPLCSLTSEEWCKVLGVPKDPSVPSWLQVSSHRSRAIYLTGLPGSVSAGKLEGDLESEADCLVEEVCIMKDFIQRKPNGIAWVLLSDETSVEKAMGFFLEGRALMFSQPYMISGLRLSIITCDASKDEDAKVRLDLEARALDAAREHAEHRALLASSYQASQERHEYAKANPAYANGRIW